MERRASNVETITLLVQRGGTTESRRLAVCGHRLLAGNADTGIFQIVENESRATPEPVKPVWGMRHDDDDGLASATIRITEPLALAKQAADHDPYNRYVP
jgi:hypothetical protein